MMPRRILSAKEVMDRSLAMGEEAERTDTKAADQFQPTHRAGYHADKLCWLLQWLTDHPDATLASGEGGILAAEIHRLRDRLHYITTEDT